MQPKGSKTMKKILMTLALLTIAGTTSATTLKIATVTPEGSQWMSEMRAGADEIKQRTDGRVQIKIYGGGVMGEDAKVLGKIRIRALQGGAFTPTALAQIYPDLNLYGLPLVFRTEEEAAYARSRLDERLHDGLLQAGFKSFGFASGGFAYLMSNKPVAKLADLRGQKVWVPEGDVISYSSMEALSLSPVTLPLTDVLTGLQTGLIDIVGMSPIGALVLQWHTKVKYVTELPMIYTLGFMAIDVKAWNKISEADQAIVEEVMRRTYAQFDEQNLVDNREARDALIKSGVQSVPFSLEEYEKVRTVMMESNRRLGEQGKFSIDLYNEMLGYIEEYRSNE
jgi:TRAP-type C4-dicarboxylate transport system substrate-binding protein